VKAMWLMLRESKPRDYIICTGRSHTVARFLEAAFGAKGLRWQDYVEMDEKFVRPNEIKALTGDNTDILELGWKPETSFQGLVEMMVSSDKDVLSVR